MSRSVVLVTVDSLRADHCGFHGYDRDTTPTLDAMAENGMTFENAISPGPSTPESMPAVLTGSYPADLDDTPSSQFLRRQERLRHHMKARETLAERFRRRGYATGGFSPNPYTSRYFGFDSGFDRYEDFIEGSREQLYENVLEGLLGDTPLEALFPARVLLNWVQREEVFKPWEAFYDRAIDWTHQSEEPYFLWVLLMDTHDPYLPPADYRTQSRRATYHANWRLWRQGHEPPFSQQTHDRLVRAYDDTIRYADAFLAQLREDLPGNPVVAVHGDHGEAFGEHGTYGHHQRLYEENIHVPLVVSSCSKDNIETPLSLAELPRLLLELARESEPTIDDGPAHTRTLSGTRHATRGRTWKYMMGPKEESVYDLRSDPQEYESLKTSELYRIGHSIVKGQLQSDQEKRRVLSAAEQMDGKT